MPAGATLVIPVACLAAVGRTLAERHIHRPKLVAKILGIDLGVELTIDHVLTLLLDRRAGRKAAPSAARLWPALTATDKVEPEQLNALRASFNAHPDVTGWIEADADWMYAAYRPGVSVRS